MSDEQQKSQIVCEEEEQEKANKALEELIEIFQKHKLRTQDLVVVYGNLGYALGASIEGVEGNEGPSVEQLKEQYYTSPTLGIALMLQGCIITSWYDQVNKGLTVDSIKENKE